MCVLTGIQWGKKCNGKLSQLCDPITDFIKFEPKLCAKKLACILSRTENEMRGWEQGEAEGIAQHCSKSIHEMYQFRRFSGRNRLCLKTSLFASLSF